MLGLTLALTTIVLQGVSHPAGSQTDGMHDSTLPHHPSATLSIWFSLLGLLLGSTKVGLTSSWIRTKVGWKISIQHS